MLGINCATKHLINDLKPDTLHLRCTQVTRDP